MSVTDEDSLCCLELFEKLTEVPTCDKVRDYDLQLAAQLGKTLLERNRELEVNLQRQQITIEEQIQEIKILSRQTTSLRNANSSFLKTSEQLEQNNVELERLNEELKAKSLNDKQKIKSLCENVEALEERCEQLQERLNGTNARRCISSLDWRRPGENTESSNLKRIRSLESFFSNKEPKLKNSAATNNQIAKLEFQISSLKCHLSEEKRRREKSELELECILQDNAALHEQLCIYESQHFDANLTDGDRMEKNEVFCNCHCCCGDTVVDRSREIEPEEPLTTESCTLMQLKNGGYAYGNRDSLEIVGTAIDSENETVSVSLLSELDDQYQKLISKYEEMVKVNKDSDSDSFPNSIEDLSKCNSPNLEIIHDGHSSLSSGFSEISDKLMVDVEVQTDDVSETILKSSSQSLKKVLSMVDAGDNSLAGHFNSGPPEYKKLFSEIFAVLKRSIPEENTKVTEVNNLEDSAKSTNECVQKHPEHTIMCHQNRNFAAWFAKQSENCVPNSDPLKCHKRTYAEVLVKGKCQPRSIHSTNIRCIARNNNPYTCWKTRSRNHITA